MNHTPSLRVIIVFDNYLYHLYLIIYCLKENNSKDDLSSCRWSMTSYGDMKTMKRNVLLIPHLCLYSQKDFHQDVGHSSDLDQKRSGILLALIDHKENGTKSLN